MMQHMAMTPMAAGAAVGAPSQLDAMMSMANRMSSLEDVIRQQEQVISATLQRIKEMEAVIGTQSRMLDQAQQHISVLSDDRSNSSESGEKLQAYVQRQSDQINALQAYVQEQMATVHGLNAKYDAVTRGIEQRIQSDVTGCLQRVQGLETSTGDAIRALQATVQQQMDTIQTTDGRAREEFQKMQHEVQGYLNNMRQQEHQLENTMREALREVHGNVSTEIKEYVTQLQAALRDAVLERNEALAALNQRITDEIAGITYNGSSEVGNLRSRIDQIEASTREGLRTAYTGLAAELANVAQHSQGVDNRQKLAHQALLQELAKHDSQMETIDVNWRASVVDLNAKLDEQLGVLQNNQRTTADNFHHQLAGLQDRFAATVDAINAQINDLAQRIHDRCIVAVETIKLDAVKQAERFVKLQEDNASTQEYLRKFSADVDRNAAQFRQIVEAAIRAAHSDLIDRINAVSAAVALRQEPAEVQQLINNAISKIWEEVNSGFTTHRDMNGLQSQLASLENAVRQEVCALADRDADILRRIDQIEIPMRVLELPTGEIIMLPRAGKGERVAAGAQATTAPTDVEKPSALASTQEGAVGAVPARREEDQMRMTTFGMHNSSGGKDSTAQDVAGYAKAAQEAAHNAQDFMEEVRRIQHEMEKLLGDRHCRAPTAAEKADGAMNGLGGQGQHGSSSGEMASLSNPLLTDTADGTFGSAGGRKVVRSDSSHSREDAGSAEDGEVSARHRHRRRTRRGEEENEVVSEDEQMQTARGSGGYHHDDFTDDHPRECDGNDVDRDTFDGNTSYSNAEHSGGVGGGGGAEENESSVRSPKSNLYDNTRGHSNDRNAPSHHRDGSRGEGRYDHNGDGDGDDRRDSSRQHSTTERRRREERAGRRSSRSARDAQRARDERRDRYEQRDRTMGREDGAVGSHIKSSSARRRAAPPLPSRLYLEKREYNNFKDFAKEEIDALWIEVMDLSRRRVVTRDELKAQLSNMKKQLLHHVMNVFHNQESELLGMLSAIKLQLRQITDNPSLMTDVALFRAPNGMVDFDRVVEHLHSPQGGSKRRTSRFEGGPQNTSELFGDVKRRHSKYRLEPIEPIQGGGGGGDGRGSRQYKQHRGGGGGGEEEQEEVYYVDPETTQQRRRPGSSDDADSNREYGGGDGVSRERMRRAPRPHEIARVPSDGHPYAVSPTYSTQSN